MQSSIHESLYQDTAIAAESLSAMMQKEQTVYASRDYLKHAAITESDRLKIVDWCYSVVDRLEFDRETVATTMELVDRFLSKPNIVAHESLRDRRQYQLVAITALYVSVKTNERVAAGSDFFAALSQGTYSAVDIEAMESEILTGLSWRVNAPTSNQIARHILSLTLPHVDLPASTWGLILDELSFQTEQAVRDYYFCMQRRSTVALAAIFNALNRVSQRDRLAVLRSLLHVITVHSGNIDFDSPEVLKATKSRLQALVKSNGDFVEEGPYAVVPVSPSTEAAEAWSLKRKSDEIIEDENTYTVYAQ